MKMGTLYKLDFSSSKSYIGITCRALKCRVGAHRRSARDGNLDVHRAWRDFGQPKVTVLAFVEEHMMPETEQKAIAVYKTFSPGGYNMTPGGRIMPRAVPAIAERMRGRKISEQTRTRMSEALKGRVFSIETIEKNRQAQLARYQDPKEREKTGLATKKGMLQRGVLGRKFKHTEKTKALLREKALICRARKDQIGLGVHHG